MSATPLSPEELRARREGAVWLVKQDRGLTAEEQDAFLAWLASDERHRAWFARHRASWLRLEGISAWGPADSAEPNPDVLAAPVQRFPAWRRWTLAAAAGIALLAGAAALSWRMPSAGTPVAQADVAAPIMTGGYERQELPDGSVVELNAGGRIAVQFTADLRRVELLAGEALFTVAKNPLRPFHVEARGVMVRAVGTAFSVRHTAQHVEVLVTEGRVQVAAQVAAQVERSASLPPEAPVLAAGERTAVTVGTVAPVQVAPASAADLARLRSWRPQMLDFSSTPLGEVLAELNRRNRRQLTLLDPESASVPIVAAIRSDNLDGFVALVAQATGLVAESRGDYEVVLRRDPR